MGNAAIAWENSIDNQIDILKIGGLKQAWNSKKRDYDSCGKDAYTLEPLATECKKCEQMNKKDIVENLIAKDCPEFYDEEEKII